MFEIVDQFEKTIAKFYGAPYAIATDSCTHAIELSLRFKDYKYISIPNRTYISIAFLPKKLGLKWDWDKNKWEDFYFLGKTNIIDAAVYWKKNGYIKGSYMCLSFQYQKHLSLGRGGMILCDDKNSYKILKKMAYDGREPMIPWRNQNINTYGFHYYMTPETAKMGLDRFKESEKKIPKKWNWHDWPDLSKLDVFQ